MKLSELLSAASIAPPAGPDIEVLGVTDDSREAKPGWLFVAVKGTQVDGHRFIPAALQAGAAAILASGPPAPGVQVPWVESANTRKLLGRLAHILTGRPSEAMLVAGVTGTNGKTTTAWLIESIFRAAGHITGLLGTVEYRIGGRVFPATTTTPSACRNAKLFAQMKSAGVSAVAMEVSSHAIDQDRIEGIAFRAGVLTNITQDHLDYHETMEQYIAAKRRFFDETIAAQPAATAVFNLGDPAGRAFSQGYAGRQITFGFEAGAAVRCLDAQVGLHGIRTRVATGGDTLDIRSRLVGRFNVENILAATAGAIAVGVDKETILEGLSAAPGVPGRFERIDEGQDFLVAVDYAHTPDALERALANAQMTPGRLIAVFGCGGDRDKTKRPKMGAAAGAAADIAILTTDNPRTEDSAAIAAMAEEGLRQAVAPPRVYEVRLDRRQAIQRAISLAGSGDFILIAGKGHEPYQEIGRERFHFDDREEARDALRAKLGRSAHHQ